jgi:hypothetical protein
VIDMPGLLCPDNRRARKGARSDGTYPPKFKDDPDSREDPGDRRSTDDLSAGLSTIGQGYRIEKAISETVKTDIELTKDLSRLHEASRTVVDILGVDLSGSGQIETILADPWRGSQVPRLVEELRSVCSRIEIALAMAAQDGAIKRRQQNPETWFFLALHDLFSEVTRNPKPGIAGPLHRFTQSCAALVYPGIRVPASENSFQKRLAAALARRTGKINAFPESVFPGK